MADGMEMMVISVLGPAVHCDWMVPTWAEAFLTSVSNKVDTDLPTVGSRPRSVFFDDIETIHLPTTQWPKFL